MALAREKDIARWITAWVGPLIAGIVLLFIGVVLFAHCQAPAGKHKKARVRVATKTMTPVSATSADSWAGGASSQQAPNSIIF